MKFIKAFGYAGNGIRHCSIYETNFKVELFCCFTVCIAGVCFHISSLEWVAIIACCMSVLVAEMINTAIETLCNYLIKEVHPAIKIVKDVAAGAVLICAIGSLVIGTIIFLPKIIEQVNLFL